MVKSFWVWPDKEPTEAEMKILMAIMLEVSIKFFYDNFVYSFGGKNFVQSSGGPIGARLTMAMSRLVMQQWWEDFDKILSGSNIDCKMRAIYVDDGRMIIKKLQKGTRYCNVQKKFIMKVDCQEEDADLTRESISEREFRKAMCDVSEDLEFTTETEKEFKNGRLPTLSFQMWSEKASIRHSYYEKCMRSQVLTQKMSSQTVRAFHVCVQIPHFVSKLPYFVSKLPRKWSRLKSKIFSYTMAKYPQKSELTL